MASANNNSEVDFSNYSNVILSAIRAVGFLKLHCHALEDSILRRLITDQQISSGATFCSSCNDELVGKHLRALALLSPRQLQLVLQEPARGLPISSPSCSSGRTSFKPSLDWKRRPLLNYSYQIKKKEVKKALLMKYSGTDKPNEVILTMQEVAFFNPVTGLHMAKSCTDHPKVSSKRTGESNISNNDAAVSTNSGQNFLPTIHEAAPVPQVKLNSEGEVIIDPESLRVRTSPIETNKNYIQEARSKEEAKRRLKKWEFKDLVKFYRGLFMFGTDFNLMAEFFPGRTRQGLKNKFKYEAMKNRDLVDRAVFTVNRSRADLADIIRMLKVDRALKSLKELK